MSLVGTLGKIAMGVMVAKGVGKVLKGGAGGGLGGLLGGLAGGNAGSNRDVDMGSLGDLLGGNTQGGSQGGAGGLGGLLDSLGGNQADGQAGGSLGGMLNQTFGGEEPQPSQEQEDQAKVMLSAMLTAAKSDGQIDAEEQAKITKHIGELTAEDAAFVRAELEAPVDVNRIINNVPQGMEQQVYMMSLLAINLDSMEEAKYLDQLAKGLNISQQMADSIHGQLGVPKLYS